MSEAFKQALQAGPPYQAHIITPIMSYLLCDHYYATELNPGDGKYVEMKFVPRGNDLLAKRNYGTVREGDWIAVQMDLLEQFIDIVVPHVNGKFVLLTTQLHMPPLTYGPLAERVLNDGKVLLWASQNPMCTHPKYMGIPYGIHHNSVNTYIEFVKRAETEPKHGVYNAPVSIHPHLPQDHVRRLPGIISILDTYHAKDAYHANLARAEFVVSTSGDRDDTYRHYECIGLSAVPVSTIPEMYRQIFGDNMIYTDKHGLSTWLQGTPCAEYHAPNRDMITVAYWQEQIRTRVKYSS